VVRRPFFVGLAALVSLAGLVLTGCQAQGSPQAGRASLAHPNTSDPPWAPEITHLRDRLVALGIPALSAEGEVLHIHQHLDIWVHGQPVEVPGGIGIDTGQGFLSPLHTHNASGEIHIESPAQRSFSLGQFFDIWGVRLSQDCLAGYCTRGQEALRNFVGGQPFDGDPRSIVLTAHEEIVLAFGTASQLPSPVPSSYSFPAGL
jgi:hypothetical protein